MCQRRQLTLNVVLAAAGLLAVAVDSDIWAGPGDIEVSLDSHVCGCSVERSDVRGGELLSEGVMMVGDVAGSRAKEIVAEHCK